MAWIQEYWQILSFLAVNLGYQIQSEAKKAIRIDTVEKRLDVLERLNESGLAARCQVHGNQLAHIEKRLDIIEGRR